MWEEQSLVSRGDAPLLMSVSSILSIGTRFSAIIELVRSFFRGWCLSMLPRTIKTLQTTYSYSQMPPPTNSMCYWGPYPWKRLHYPRYSVLYRQVVYHRWCNNTCSFVKNYDKKLSATKRVIFLSYTVLRLWYMYIIIMCSIRGSFSIS